MKNSNAVYISIVALILSIVSLALCLTCKKGDVAGALKANPELVVQAMQDYETQQRENAMKLVEENLKKYSDELYARADDGIIGNPNGKMVLVEFFDFSCGFCRRVHPAIKEIVANNPDVKVIAKPMTFLSPASKYAAKVALAAAEQGKFADMYNAFFEFEGRLSESKIDELATNAGLDMEKLKADMESDKVNKTLSATAELAGKVNVSGVPTMVFNNKILQTLDASVIQEAIDAAK
ncbi:MAG: thioredoxin domain-containing protein [Alphaproteobacteria bacterium]|nr:thioredoxin domain-containing protein [Alphaproteobacteria bacterium]